MATASQVEEHPAPSHPRAWPPGRVRFTVDDYYRMAQAGILDEDSRVELIDGDVIAMSPLGPSHAGEVDRLNRVFQRRVEDRAIVRVQNPVRLNPRSEPQPDLTLLRPRDDFYRTAHPEPADVLLLIEVMDSSASYDRGTKLGLYAREGIAEVWLIDLNGDRVEVYRRPDGERYADALICERGQAIAPLAFPDLRLEADDILG